MIRRATFPRTRVTCIVVGGVAMLVIVLAENALTANPNDNQSLLAFVSVVLGGWCGEAWWRWQRRRSS